MKVTAWKNIDVDVEVDVSVDEILVALGERLDDVTPKQWRTLGCVLDTITKMLARVTDEAIRALPDEARIEMCRRLDTERKRYAFVVPESGPLLGAKT